MASPIDDLTAHAAQLRSQIAEEQAAAAGDDYLRAQSAKAMLPKLNANLTQVEGMIQRAQPNPAADKPVKSDGTFYVNDPNKPGSYIPAPGAPAAGTQTPGTVPAKEQADTNELYRQGLIDSKQLQLQLNKGQLDREAAQQLYQQKHDQLMSEATLKGMDATQALAYAQQGMAQWSAGIDAGVKVGQLQNEGASIGLQAGNLGVSRGNLGVSQEQADTQREQVVQTAQQNAINNTFELMKRYIPTNGGASDPFFTKYAAGLNNISGGKTNYQASDFMTQAPDLQAISQRAAADAVARMKGGGLSTPPPATAQAIGASGAPTAATAAPVAIPAQPAAPPPPAGTAQQQAGVAANNPVPIAGLNQVQTPPYLGPGSYGAPPPAPALPGGPA